MPDEIADDQGVSDQERDTAGAEMMGERQALEGKERRCGADDEPVAPAVPMMKGPSLDERERVIKEGGQPDD